MKAIMNRVLCIDDDSITLMLCKATIKQASFSEEIDTALNGQDAIEYYEDLLNKSVDGESYSYPQVIFLDLNMPILSGWEFLDEFMNRYYLKFNKTRVVILSSTVDHRDRERAAEYPIVMDFYSKPITKEILHDIGQKLN